MSHAYSEVTRAICRVPSAQFSQAPWYALPDHLCRFRVRSIRWGYFLEPLHCPTNPIRKDNLRDPSHTTRPTNINVVPIDYPLRARLRGRLTLRRLTLRKETLGFRRAGFSPALSLLMSAFALPIRPESVTLLLRSLTERSATAAVNCNPKLRCISLAPLHLRRRNPYLDQ